MEKFKVEKISPILVEEQLRMDEVINILTNLFKVSSIEGEEFSDIVMDILNYMLSFYDIYNKNMTNILQEVGLTNVLEVIFERKKVLPKTNKFVNPKIFELFYSNIWQTLILDSVFYFLKKEQLSTGYRFSKDVIKTMYNNSSTCFKEFKEDIYELFLVNGFEVVIVDEGDNYYTVEVDL